MRRVTALILLSTASLMAQAGPDVERFRPTDEQAWKLSEYSQEYGRIEVRLAKMYGDLKLLGYVSDAEDTLISMRNSHLRQFELKDSTLSEETVRIVWKNGEPSQVSFRIRTAGVRSMRTVVTIFKVGSVRQATQGMQGQGAKEPDIEFISTESLSSGNGNQVYYLLTAWDAPVLTEKTRSFTDGGATMTVSLSQIRDPAMKVEVMNRILDSYRYLERHLDYLVSRSIHKELDDMNRYIPKS